jgi:hypothetical protein
VTSVILRPMTHTPVRRTLVVLALVVAALAASAGTAQARTDTRSKPVLLVHGYNPTSNSTDCGGDFNQMISELRGQGFTGPMVRVGFYSGDVNCDVNLRSYGSFGNSSSWREIAKALSQYIARVYPGQAVDVVGYSMGGLIARGAVHGSQRGEAGFARAIDVEDVVTLGTPHNGAAWYSNLCLFGQCATLKPGASDLNWLNLNGNPQDANGTEFTVVGSNGDWVVPTSSALFMTTPIKVTYCCTPHTGGGNYMHTSAVIARSANALAFGGQ